MRAVMESLFYAVYLFWIFFSGIRLLRASKTKKEWALFGWACLLLGFGDAFHLAPRAVGLFTKTLSDPSETLSAFLGAGKAVTSVTMTLFYLLFYFYFFARVRKKRSCGFDFLVIFLVLSRLLLCAFPQNAWLTGSSPLLWGVLRNVPFVLFGALMIVLAKKIMKQKPYSFLWLAILLSFGFYLPVVLFAHTASWVGMLMLPKTVCYLWIAGMGVRDIRMENSEH